MMNSVGQAQGATGAGAKPRKPARPSALWLVVGALALFIFINALGDWRRKHNAIAQARWYADALASRLGEAQTLPLNFEPDVPEHLREGFFKMEWLSTDDARHLRGEKTPILVARTVPLPIVTGRDGRAVVWFRDGRFEPQWLSLDEFDQAQKTQEALLRSHASIAQPQS
jgi:hypothetical protein